MNAIKRYQCSKCDEIHDEEWEAEQCCPVATYDVWQCPICREHYESEAEAQECIDEHVEVEPALGLPTIAELEAAGQLRLPECQ